LLQYLSPGNETHDILFQ